MNVDIEFLRLVRKDAAVANMARAGLSFKEMVVLLANSRQKLLDEAVKAERLRPVSYIMTSDAMMRRWGDLRPDESSEDHTE